MSYYAVVHHAIEDPKRYGEDYIPGAVEIITRHGGEVAAAAEAAPIEGKPPAPGVVILKFPSEEAFRSFYDDPDYQPLKKLRHSLTRGGSMVGTPSFGA
ncbi:uncharacterized protein (DUF1330 family) [Arthrobacter sp. SLBN-100]|uniref:DUF1330 domain-containing protein n=1 Tax=Arthrobacter sp. SLBN-100 TaxID=2768450 RepID=UPI0011544C3C|nr:DUF1330 domain-containing protein [Arthrobacter sp. SLBN-100]TQJ61959.1 uncharacterized protein (DUF1330 family) [Arthrobacter sp. SLBN-100]